MRKSHKIIISGVIGNILENYDYVLYANFAVVISKLFFPTGDLYTSLIATFGVFAAGFFMRPLGAIIFGYIGDKYGRKIALSTSIMLMSIPTALIGTLPSYAEIGILAPIALVIIRLLQGVSIGGETSGFMTYLMESMPDSKRKVLLGSIALSSTALGLFFGFLASFICNFYFSATEWAWRVPFLISFPVGIIGIYIRTKLDESQEFKALKDKGQLAKSPFKELFKNHTKRFLVICGLFVSISVPFYIFFGFLATFLVKILNYSQLQVSIIYLFCTFSFGCFAPLSGWLSDKFGIFKVLLCSIVTFAVFLFPVFGLIFDSNFVTTLLGCLAFIFLITLYQGSIPSIILQIFPTKVRASGTAFSFNMVSAIFGGLTPLVLTWLIKISENYYVIPCYLLISSAITIAALLLGRKIRSF
ncbi:MAG: MFS transporter [Proteobacteria bacterium]|nr:MFS transporter [Pseudomonadota bacterium]